MRRRVYEILTGPRANDGVGRAVSFCLLALIAANVIASVLETDVEIHARAPQFFQYFEWVSVAIFTVELVLRVWSAAEDPAFRGIGGRLRMAARPMSIVDLMSIVPTYVELLFHGFIDLRFLRVLRLLRVFRMLRIPRVAQAFSMLVRVIMSRRAELGVTLAFVITATLIAAGSVYIAERGHDGTHFTSIPRAMWWAICTVTTIGYGDVVPVTTLGRVIASVIAFVGICAIALPVGILSSGFIDEINNRKREGATSGTTCPTCGRLVE